MHVLLLSMGHTSYYCNRNADIQLEHLLIWIETCEYVAAMQ